MDDAENFLAQTREILARYGLSDDDVSHLTHKEDFSQYMSWLEFCHRADRIYDSGFGSNETNLNLVLVCNNGGQLRRWEYDGSEGWEYIPPAPAPNPTGARPAVWVNDADHYPEEQWIFDPVHLTCTQPLLEAPESTKE